MSRGRPRNFDEAEVLERVLNSFRRGGYAGTNFEQLVAESGLSRSSLYNAFGGKDELFGKALELYISRELDGFIEGLNQPGGMTDFIEYWKEPYVSDGEDCDCLMRHFLLENAAAGGEPRQKGAVMRGLAKMWDGFARALGGQPRGPAADEQERAAMVLAMMIGVMVISRNGRNQELVEAVSDGAKKIIGAE